MIPSRFVANLVQNLSDQWLTLHKYPCLRARFNGLHLPWHNFWQKKSFSAGEYINEELLQNEFQNFPAWKSLSYDVTFQDNFLFSRDVSRALHFNIEQKKDGKWRLKMKIRIVDSAFEPAYINFTFCCVKCEKNLMGCNHLPRQSEKDLIKICLTIRENLPLSEEVIYTFICARLWKKSSKMSL